MMQAQILSGFEILWMIVLFDLPVVEPEERKAATEFRNGLLKLGFSMSQYSVYYKVVSGKDKAEGLEKHISKIVPNEGRVDIVRITDKQYENILSFEGKAGKARGKTKQLALL